MLSLAEREFYSASFGQILRIPQSLQPIHQATEGQTLPQIQKKKKGKKKINKKLFED
jgi:hypothetical protein